MRLKRAAQKSSPGRMTATATVWYFAYGSNMNRAQMRSRTGQILEEQPGRFGNYEMLFNRKSRGGSATANIRSAPGKIVYGVLYKVPDAAFRSLDRFEGVPEHYRRIEVSVTDSAGRKVTAQVYVATRVEKAFARRRTICKSFWMGLESTTCHQSTSARSKQTPGSIVAVKSGPERYQERSWPLQRFHARRSKAAAS